MSWATTLPRRCHPGRTLNRGATLGSALHHESCSMPGTNACSESYGVHAVVTTKVVGTAVGASGQDEPTTQALLEGLETPFKETFCGPSRTCVATPRQLDPSQRSTTPRVPSSPTAHAMDGEEADTPLRSVPTGSGACATRHRAPSQCLIKDPTAQTSDDDEDA